MQLLVTGANGFIGRHLCKRLIEQGYQVRALVRDLDKPTGLDERVTRVLGDVTDPASLDGVEQGIEGVLHLAALGHVSAISQEAFRNFVRVNVKGTRNLLNRFTDKGISRFVHVSSTAAMGLIRKPIVNEDDPPEPATPYQHSKFESEETALAYHYTHGLPVCVTRPCMVYGVGGEGEFLKQARLIKKGIFPRVGLGRNLTPLVHVADVVSGLIGALERGAPGETYLLCGADSIALNEMRAHVLRALGISWRPYVYAPRWAMRLAATAVERLAQRAGTTPVVTRRNIENTIFDRRFSIAKARRQLAYDPEVTPEEGIAETIAWFKETGRI